MLRLLLGDSRAASISLHVLCGLVLAFLVAPLLTILPLSVNEEAYFTFPIHQYSMRWYQALMLSPEWRLAAVNSLMVALGATMLATVLETPAARARARRGGTAARRAG